MYNWWVSLTDLEQIMACVAMPSTIILVVQTILILFTAFGGDGDLDSADGEGFDGAESVEMPDGLQIFTVRGFVSFFSIFGWSGLLFLRVGMHEVVALLIAFILGGISMMTIALAFSAMMKLQDSGNVDPKTALGVSGVVYMTIPKNRSNMGKVSAIVSGRYSEYDAVTDDESDIKTGTQVVVVALTAPNVLVVAKK